VAEIKVTFDAAADYERFMGAWSRAIGETFLAWLGAPPAARWLDIGCGSGALSELIVRHAAPASLTGIDPSPEQIAYVREHLPGAVFEVADALSLPFCDESFDVVASALVLHFIPDRRRALAEMRRVLRPRGQVGGYTWKRTATEDFAPYAPLMAGARSIGAEPLTSPLVPEGTAAGMRESLAAAGFIEIDTTEIEVTRTFASFDDYWDVQTIAFSPPGRTIAKLDGAQRARLQDLMRQRTTAGSDGRITHTATAVAGKGRR
jgi:ubiquinone/menaquinone biosynthesis C-methylase UbiE